jgi:hypothetical protein
MSPVTRVTRPCDPLQPATKIDTTNFRLVMPDQPNKAERMERHHRTLCLWEPAVVSSQTIRRADLISKPKWTAELTCANAAGKSDSLLAGGERAPRQSVFGAAIFSAANFLHARNPSTWGGWGVNRPRIFNELWMRGS